MRTTVLPSMLEILTRNYNYRNKAAYLYEMGRVYFKRPGRHGGRAEDSSPSAHTARMSTSSPSRAGSRL